MSVKQCSKVSKNVLDDNVINRDGQNIDRLLVSSGYEELDDLSFYFRESELILIGGRTSIGKTPLIMNLLHNICIKQGMPVLMLSLESSSKSIKNRLLSCMTEISLIKIENLKSLTPKNRIALESAEDKIKQSSLYLDDCPNMGISHLKETLKKLTKKSDNTNPVPRVIFIDSLGLLSSDQASLSEYESLNLVIKQLKFIAREFNITIVCTTQLSRGIESRFDKRPMLTDLPNSGALENEADVAMLMYRDNYYNPAQDNDEIELHIAKHRNGNTGTIKLTYLDECFKILGHSKPKITPILNSKPELIYDGGIFEESKLDKVSSQLIERSVSFLETSTEMNMGDTFDLENLFYIYSGENNDLYTTYTRTIHRLYPKLKVSFNTMSELISKSPRSLNKLKKVDILIIYGFNEIIAHKDLQDSLYKLIRDLLYSKKLVLISSNIIFNLEHDLKPEHTLNPELSNLLKRAPVVNLDMGTIDSKESLLKEKFKSHGVDIDETLLNCVINDYSLDFYEIDVFVARAIILISIDSCDLNKSIIDKAILDIR